MDPLSGHRIAIVSSGARHIKRGIEAWALDLARSLYELNVNVVLYVGSGPSQEAYEKTVACMPRNGAWNRFITKWSPKFFWRWHLTSDYPLEQLTFALSLVLSGKLKSIDLVHTQDPVVASVLEWFRKWKFIKAKTLLAHGTEEEPHVLQTYAYLQHLAPHHMQELIDVKNVNSYWVAVPNFVDTQMFAPRQSNSIRNDLNIPEESIVFLCVAAVKKHHKRIDYLINEFAEFKANAKSNAHLIIAGASHEDTPSLIALAEKRCRNNIHIITDKDRTCMPEICNAGDVFVMTSLKEMMPIALLEAIASGLPAIVSKHPVVTWMRGDAGESVDMSKEGALAAAFTRWSEPTKIQNASVIARDHALSLYSKEAVTKQLISVYKEIM